MINENQISASELPFCFSDEEEQYSMIRYGELLCPGVYFIVTNFPEYSLTGEYIVTTADSPAISSAARAFCMPLSKKAVLCKTTAKAAM